LARGVVVIFAEKFRRKSPPDTVTVLASAELRPWLKKRPTVLDARTIDLIFERARRGDVWCK
jgi:hypothetical protein